MSFPSLTTERLLLRQLSESDKEQLFLLRSDDVINRYLDRPPCKSLDDAISFVKTINENIKKKDSFYWAIALTKSNKLIGTIGLFNFSDDLKRCEIGYELLNEYQGKGYMSETIKKIIDFAMKTLGVKTIEAFTHKDNQSSTKLLERFNFVKTEIKDDNDPDFRVYRLGK